MNFVGDKEYWNEKYRNRGNKILRPEQSLVENIRYFKEGSILDIACGDGRNTMFLLEKGFRVTGVDFCTEALDRLRIFADKNNYLVNTKQIDLSRTNSLENIGVFNNILINHYKLGKEQLADIKEYVADGGILFICGFGEKHKTNDKITEEDLIYPKDFEDIKKSFKLIRYIENEDDRGNFVTYIFEKIRESKYAKNK